MPASRGTYVPEPEVARAGALMRELGVEAVTAPGPEARIRILGQVWAACADCHVQAGVG